MATTKRFRKNEPVKQGSIPGESILTLEQQLGTVELELNRPLPGKGKEGEEVTVLTVEAPSTRAISIFENTPTTSTPEDRFAAEVEFYGSCCVNIPAAQVEELHAKDWRRLQRLTTNFVS